MYALIVDNAIVRAGSLPRTWFDGTRWWDFRTGTPDPSTGWLEVVDTARPADTATHTHDRTIELVTGTPTVVWTQRAFTADELAAIEAAANYEALGANPQTQIDELLAVIAAIVAIRQRTNAEINANPAAALKDALSEVLTGFRKVVRLARRDLGVLDSTEGT